MPSKKSRKNSLLRVWAWLIRPRSGPYVAYLEDPDDPGGLVTYLVFVSLEDALAARPLAQRIATATNRAARLVELFEGDTLETVTP